MRVVILILVCTFAAFAQQESKSVRLNAEQTKDFNELLRQRGELQNYIEKLQAQIDAANAQIETRRVQQQLLLTKAGVPEAWWNNGTLNPTDKVWIFSAPEKPKE